MKSLLIFLLLFCWVTSGISLAGCPDCEQEGWAFTDDLDSEAAVLLPLPNGNPATPEFRYAKDEKMASRLITSRIERPPCPT